MLSQTIEAVKTGDFGEDEDHSKWVSQLERIAEKIAGSMDNSLF